MKVIVIVGMPGSGKTVFSDISKKLGIFTLTSGDIIREEVKNRGLVLNEFNELKIARWFNRSSNEELIAQRIYEKIKNAEYPSKVVIQGIRSPQAFNELKRLLKGEKVTLLAIHSLPEIRYKREKERKRYDGKEDKMIKLKDKQQLEHGLGKLIFMADEKIVNNNSLSKFKKTVKNKLIKILNIRVKR